MEKPLLSIIIPAFNEKNTIGTVVEKVNSLNIDKEIIIIDDCSTDGTFEKLKSIAESQGNIKLIRHEKNYGKGRCIRDGFAQANGDIAIIQDADLEYDPQDIPKVIQPIIDGYADVVYGSRFGGYPRRALFFWHSIGNRFLTFVSNLFTNLNLTDMETCYKAFKKIVYKNIKLTSDGFTIEPEITAKIARMRLRVYEVPISYRGRSYWEGKKINWKDGIKALLAIIKHSLFSKISDDIGFQTLEMMNSVEAYNRMIFSKIKPYIGQRVLEIGSGIGNITKYLISKDFVLATDISDSYLHILTNLFENSPNIAVQKLDLNNFNTDEIRKHKIDTIVCLNVLEHLNNDKAIVKKLGDCLTKDGRLTILVPACQWAYGSLDSNLGHVKRYSKSGLEEIAKSANFKVEKINYFNVPGIFGWFVSGKILRRRALSKSQMRLFNLLRPILWLENIISPPFGLSLIAILTKK